MTRLRSSAFLRQGALVFAGSTFLNAAGFVFHMIATRTLGPAEYGTLYALLSAMVLSAGPVQVAVPVLTRFAAEFRALDDRAHQRGLILGLGRAFLIFTACVAVATALGAVPLGAFLHAPPWSIPVTGLLLCAVLASTLYRGVAQGMHDFEGYAISNAGDGVVKMIATVAFAALGWRLFGALGGFCAGSLAGAALVIARVLPHALRSPEAPVRYDWRRIAYAAAGSAALALASSLLGNVDVIIVKHAFDAAQAGIYSAASLGGKILLFGVGFVPAVLVPQAADRNARGQTTIGVLATSCGIVIGCGALCVLLFAFFGPLLLRVLAGPGYEAASGLLVWYGVAMLFVALVSAIASYGIATHRLAFGWWVVAGSVATTVALAAFHPSLDTVVRELAAGSAATAALAGAAVLRQERSAR